MRQFAAVQQGTLARAQLLMKELLCKGRSPLFLLMINDHTDRCRRQETIGNSVAVAVKHYLQVTDEHFEKAVQKAVQQSAALGRMESQEQHGFTTESAFCEPERRYAKQCEKVKEGEMGDTGLEPVTSRV